MLFCVFLLCEGQNIVLICFAGSRLKIDSMLVLYHFSVSSVRWFRLCKHVPNSWFLWHFWCIPPLAMMTVTADPGASLGHSCGCPSPWQKQLQALLGCVCPSQADEELKSLRGWEVLLPSSPFLPCLPQEHGNSSGLGASRTQEEVLGCSGSVCSSNSCSLSPPRKRWQAIWRHPVVQIQMMDHPGLDGNTGMSWLVSAISYGQNNSKLEDRHDKTYLPFWI